MTIGGAVAGVETRLDPMPCYCPIEPRRHPDADAVELAALAWMDAVPLHQNDFERACILRAGSADLVSRFAPDGIVHNTAVVARWVDWSYAFTLARCDPGVLGERPAEFRALAGTLQGLIEAPREPMPGDDHFTVALTDLSVAFHEIGTPAQLQRLADAHRRWLYGVQWRAGNLARGRLPEIDEHTATRLGNCGGPPVHAMLEIANGVEVPGVEMAGPQVQALTEMACLIVGWDNDLRGYAVDGPDDGDTVDLGEQTIINVLRLHHGMRADQAYVEAVRMRDRVMHLFLRLRERTLLRCGEEVRGYLACLGYGIRGNLDRALHEAAAAGAPDPGWTDDPADPRTDRLPIPLITWWWELI